MTVLFIQILRINKTTLFICNCPLFFFINYIQDQFREFVLLLKQKHETYRKC